jgi:hypothetical protein
MTPDGFPRYFPLKKYFKQRTPASTAKGSSNLCELPLALAGMGKIAFGLCFAFPWRA